MVHPPGSKPYLQKELSQVLQTLLSNPVVFLIWSYTGI